MASAETKPRREGEGAAGLLAAPLTLLMRLVDGPMRALQRLIGERRMAYVLSLIHI